MASGQPWYKFGKFFTKMAMTFLFILIIFVLILFWKMGSYTSARVSMDQELGRKQDVTRDSVATGPPSSPTAVKRILLWTSYFGHEDFYFGLGREPFLRRDCAVTECEVTTDRSQLQNSDAIVFHFQNMEIQDLPKWRRPDQRWVFFLKESPAHTSRKSLERVNGLFNWTMTYRLDSDIVNNYGDSIKIGATSRPPESKKETSDKKRRLAAWLVSHCKTKGQREKYVEELQRHISVDIYGGCAKDKTQRTCPEESCGVALYRSHKFYLSFENSVCRDYVTEKFFKALRHHVVPVVYGGADYARVAPPGSYVDVRDFDSPRHLAEHLKMLDANDTLYEEYLGWTEDWKIVNNSNRENSFCKLCGALHNPLAVTNATNKVYHDIVSWWADPNICSEIKLNDTIN